MISSITRTVGGNITLQSVVPIEMMMILGVYRFCIRSAAYEAFKRQTEYNWQSQNRIGAEPAMQFVGGGEDTISLEGTIYPHFRGGLRQVSLMRAQAGLGRPLFLISGNGAAFGRWCITEVGEEQTVFMRDGAARKVEFHLTLKRYGENQREGAMGIVQQIVRVL